MSSLLTVLHVQEDGIEQVFLTRGVLREDRVVTPTESSPNTHLAVVICTPEAHQVERSTLSGSPGVLLCTGKVYVMNDNGKTVRTYDLDRENRPDRPVMVKERAND